MDKLITNIQRTLTVPQSKPVREKIHETIREFVAEKHIQPPIEFNRLQQLTHQVFEQNNFEKEFLDFGMVMMGNAIWADRFRSVPFNRRLLLLPQCIRNKQKCKGSFDDLGLICAGCRQCKIDETIEKAEKLGYATLVAEGSTVAIGLIEEGSIDAVLGVSCMSVLQKSFTAVTRAAVPGIGIPLLQDGCENTTLDYDWLYEEMEKYSNNPDIQPISVSLVKRQVQECFEIGNVSRHFNAQSNTDQLAIRSLTLGGQLMRPQLAALAYQSYAKNISNRVQDKLCLITECFHKASLLHDDIQDNDEFRYNEKTLHTTDGVPTAINVGDFLIGKGYQLISSLECKNDVKSKCLAVASQSHLKLCEGQGDDLMIQQDIQSISSEKMIEIYRMKTGEAVKAALLLGAVAGEASDSDIDKLTKFSEHFGIAYQIRDDLNELRENSDKHAFDFPLLLVLLRNNLNGETHRFGQFIKPENLDKLLNHFETYKIEQMAVSILKMHIEICYQITASLENQKMKLCLFGLMGKIFKESSDEQPS